MAKTKLNSHLRSALVKCIERGVPVEQACHAVRISSATYRRWLARGENPSGVEDDIYVLFLEDISQAEAKFIKSSVELIQNAARRDAHHAEWLLERRFPALFGKRMEIEVGPSKALTLLQDMMVAELEKPEDIELLEDTKQLTESKDETDNEEAA